MVLFGTVTVCLYVVAFVVIVAVTIFLTLTLVDGLLTVTRVVIRFFLNILLSRIDAARASVLAFSRILRDFSIHQDL